MRTKVIITACFEAAAKATGCTVDIGEIAAGYDDMHHNSVMTDLYETNSKQLGVTHVEYPHMVGSTDMGNVCYIVPAIHPMYAIGDGTKPWK